MSTTAPRAAASRSAASETASARCGSRSRWSARRGHLWLLVAIFAPLVAPYDPLAQAFTPLAVAFGRRTSSARTSSAATCSQPRHLRRPHLVAARPPPRRLSPRRSAGSSAPSPATSGSADGAMRTVDLVFAFPAIILAMVVAAALGRAHERGPRAGDRLLAVVRARRAQPRALGRRLGVRLVDAPARQLGSSRARPGRAAERRRPGARARDPGARQRDPAALRPLVPRSRRPAAGRRVGLDGRDGHAVLPVLVDGHFPGPRDLHRGARVQLHR